ncbi:MAG: VOC family protein [Chloroflexota bacterium]
MTIRALSYVGLETADLDRWVEFADGVLGMPSTRDGDDRALVRMDQRVYRFDIRQGGADRLAWLGWEVSSAAELAETAEALRARGVEVVPGDPAASRSRRIKDMIVAHDPAGNRLEIFYGQESDFGPFRTTRPMEGYLTGDLGMGHAVIGVADLDANLRFYTEVLGFRVSDLFKEKMAFLHCNPRHHSLALVQSDAPGLRHIMLEVRSLDDVGLTLDIGMERGAVTRRLGRHTNDEAVSFYLETPSGWEIEFGWAGFQVDDANWSVRQIAGATSLWGHQPVDGRESFATAGRETAGARKSP